jgi:hypothetical protein
MLAIMLPSHPGDGAVGTTWLRREVDAKSCWRQCATRVTWPRCDVDVESCYQQCYRVMLAAMLLSHAGNGATGVIWSWRDVDVESCWRQ